MITKGQEAYRALPPDQQLLTTGEVAEMMGVERASVIRWCDSGKMGSIRTPGGHRRIPLTEVRKYLGEPGR